jgi:UDP-N-acetylmuramate dehydrogenase
MNTFGMNVSARYFAAVDTVDSIEAVCAFSSQNRVNTLILGGGSNILFTADIDGLVIKNDIKGIEKVDEDDDYFYVKAGAGENWHQFVMYCIANQYAGVENLALIPGNVGASPMQNIGAYGVEIKDVFHSLEAYHLSDAVKVSFSNSDCAFGYRESVFKNKYKGQFIITSVTYKLKKKPDLNISYGSIEQELTAMGIKDVSPEAIANAVIRIRRSKLPDPAVIGNAGSFFKNPEVSSAHFIELKSQFPDLVGYNLENGNVKVAAGWLIEKCGWKGYRKGDAGCHEKQALVLVNYGDARGEDIYTLSENILISVKETFGIDLVREVNIVPGIH